MNAGMSKDLDAHASGSGDEEEGGDSSDYGKSCIADLKTAFAAHDKEAFNEAIEELQDLLDGGGDEEGE
jgi:hypothetical protein